MNHRNRFYAQRLRNLLVEQGVFEPGHQVISEDIDDGIIRFQYVPLTSNSDDYSYTIFNVNPSNKTAEIERMRVAQKGSGIGRKTYETIEGFCRQLGCVQVITEPWEDGLYFWPAMGFDSRGNGVSVKSIDFIE